jgi:hypothetical protein
LCDSFQAKIKATRESGIWKPVMDGMTFQMNVPTQEAKPGFFQRYTCLPDTIDPRGAKGK